MNTIQEQIKNYILTEFAYDRQSIAPDDDLLGQGILDSMGVMQLVDYIEANHGVQISDEDIVPENFRSLNTLQEMISHKNQVSP